MPTVYEIITSEILERLEAGTPPWRCTWNREAGMPRNLHSGAAYRGINPFLLTARACTSGYSAPWWLTYKQAQARGGNVRKGEKSAMVIFWKWVQKAPEGEAQSSSSEKGYPVLRYYQVFNVEQCDGIEYPRNETQPREHTAIEAAEQLVMGYRGAPAVSHGGSMACYIPNSDAVRIPKPESFEATPKYYCALFHELGHSTGHRSRLARDGVVNHARFASHEYSREELVAEFTASFLCGVAGIERATIENSAAYIAGWRRSLTRDAKAVVMAAAQAQRAADWIQDKRFEREQDQREAA
jgi:antirestriction protein ArdC